jgi:peptidoglycan-associated lipoprotein
MMQKLCAGISIALLAVGGTTACATKKLVKTSVGEVNDKVDSLGRSVEETQERTRKNEARIADVDQKAQNAANSAQQANGAAAAAQSTAVDARSAANTVDSKLDTFDKASRRLVFEVVLSEDQGNFKFGKADLPDQIKQKIDEMVSQIKQDPKNVFIEIEGHTDDVGPAAVNEKIGLERAQAVQRYLYEQYQIPLHKINVISYGESKPAVPNKTKEGRAQNRRVVIRVLA